MSSLAILFASADYPRTKQLLGRYTYFNVIVLLATLLLTGSAFYVWGGLTDPTNPLIVLMVSLILAGCLAAGIWIALKATGYQSSLLLETISPATTFWLRTLQVLIFTLPVGLVTLTAYITGIGVADKQTWDILAFNILSTILLPAALALLGASIVYLIRRVFHHYLARTVLIAILLGFWAYFFISRVEISRFFLDFWLYGNLNQMMILFLGLVTLITGEVMFLELVFTHQPVRLNALPKYWKLWPSRRLINVYDTPMALINREFLHFLRDTVFQRRLLSYVIVLILFVMAGATLLTSEGSGRMAIFAFSLSIGLTALAVSYRSGTRARQFSEKNQYLPVTEKVVYWSFWTASLVVLSLVMVLFIGLTLSMLNLPWSTITGQLIVIGLTAHLLSFFFGYRHADWATDQANDLTAVLVTLAIALVPIVYFQQVSVLLTLAVLILWLAVLALFLRVKTVNLQ
ncbi:MAG TPA: hypothetical protein VMQ44_02590 [Candidatus Saccharimonadales bacterium]|nr:hypothetical protein [Candidatus Saccharimonadales bacterium]